MAYKERLDGRKDNELRPMEAKIKVIPNAAGSASFKIGKTWAIAAVYGPREVFPRFLADPKKGLLRCHYSMMMQPLFWVVFICPDISINIAKRS